MSSNSYSELGRIVFTLIKNGNSDNTSDDKLTVRPDVDSNGYNVTFDQKTILNTVNAYVTNEDFLGYLNNFFNSISLDSDPCEFVQIDCPSYPTILLKSGNVLGYLPVLQCQIAHMQEHWPMEYSGSKNLPNKSHTYNRFANIYLVLQSAGRKDDILRISKHLNGYKVRLEQNNINNTTVRYIPNSDILYYLECVFRTILSDEEAYSGIQVDCPLFPTVLLPRQSLENYSKVMYDQILFLQKNWPLEHSGKQVNKEEKLDDTHGYHDYENLTGRYFDNFGMC